MEGEFKDTAEGISLADVKKRTISGILFLTFRTFVLQVIGFVGVYVLMPLFLKQGEYGVYIIVNSVISFLAYFSDIGLAAALVQKKESLSDKDLKTTFFVQQLLVIIAILTVFALTPFIKTWQHFDQTSIYLMWALLLSFFLSSLKTIPSVLLERKLDFGRLIIPQVVETLLFNLVAVYLAWNGFGIASFIYAVLIRGIAGLILMYILQPWKPGFALEIDSLKQLLRFGVPYQASSFLSVFKDDGMILFLGGFLGSAPVASLGLAKKWSEAPLRFFMDQVIKVTFPAYSRMQDSKEELNRAVTKSIFFISFLVFPFVMGLALVIPLLIDLVPRYEQWRSGLLLFMIFGINTFWAAVTTPLTTLLDAIGKVKVRFYLMVMWTALSWLFIPALAHLYGVIGATIGYSIVGSSSFIAIFIARRYVKFDLIISVVKPLIASLAMGLVVYLVRGLMPASWYWIFILIVFGMLVYLVSTILLIGPSLIADGRKAINAVLKKS